VWRLKFIVDITIMNHRQVDFYSMTINVIGIWMTENGCGDFQQKRINNSEPPSGESLFYDQKCDQEIARLLSLKYGY
jgi:hypothetical protein